MKTCAANLAPKHSLTYIGKLSSRQSVCQILLFFFFFLQLFSFSFHLYFHSYILLSRLVQPNNSIPKWTQTIQKSDDGISEIYLMYTSKMIWFYFVAEAAFRTIYPLAYPPPTVCPCKCFFCVSGERFSGYGLGVKAVPRASPLGKKWSLNLALGTRDLLMHVVYDFYPTDSRENNGHGTGPRQFGFDVADRPTVPGSRARQSHVHRALKMKHSKIL